MTLKIDNVGRIILPKSVRNRLGLHAGSVLEIEEIARGVVLKPADRKPSLIRRGKFLVHTGEIQRGYDIRKAIEEERDEQMRRAWGV
jgi:AbrB family looped-hinge helix DNA binding protein